MHASQGSKLSSTFDALARSSARRLHRRPRAPFFVIGLVALLAAGLFLAILVEDRQLQRDGMHRDIDSAALQLGTRLSTLSETLSSMAREIGSGNLTERRFAALSQDLVNAKPELDRMEYVDATGQPVWVVLPTTSTKPPASVAPPRESESSADPLLKSLLTRLARGQESVYLPLPAAGRHGALILLAVPVYIERQLAGAVVARIDPLDLIINGVPEGTLDRYRLTLTSAEHALASTSSSAPPSDALTYTAMLPPLPSDYRLQASAFRLQSRFTTSALVWVVAGLTVAVLVALSALARFTTRQQRIDRALLAETTLRRAMEDSLATGLGVIDPTGTIRYVNRTFCQMTGFAESELVACAPPYPFWPPDQHAANEALLHQMLAGNTLPGGFEIVVQRKDGQPFHASMHVSALLDEANRHIGWMVSMADVTESARARNELAAAHERFTTVLESLEAAVSVAVPLPDDSESEVVFANRAYLSLFGDGAEGHLRLAAQLRGRDGAEVQDRATERWFDVRMRGIRWPVNGYDGGVQARLQIATDITLRKVTDDLARQQQEKVQFTSRLMTMGEMASSLAHELNQPLTAITNYSEGTLSRLKERQISIDELQSALEKTSAQAQRAGGIIRRIREFVKRSEPRRRPTPPQRIVEDAIGFAEIEANKKGIHIAASIDPTLEPLLVDPLLIEQVLLNLLKNAIDAMEHASARRIDVVVRRSLLDGMAEFAVIDRGSGIPEESLPMLFEPFFSTKSEGMGMGLNICRSIIEFHQGRLTVEKNPEGSGGTIMRFTLPIAIEPGAEAAPAAANQGEFR